MILTGKEIVDLARIAGLPVEENMLDAVELETEITIIELEGKKIAHYYEYPDEGALQLG
jgi:hypothetical protein